MKKRTNNDPDLSAFDARTILEESRLQAGLSNQNVGKRMGLGTETVARYQREPEEGERDYGLPIRRVRIWNQAAGNDLVIQWLCQDCGGVFVRVDGDCTDAGSITQQMGKVSKEAHEAIAAWLKAIEDGEYEASERLSVTKELRDLVMVAQTALRKAEGKPTNQRRA